MNKPTATQFFLIEGMMVLVIWAVIFHYSNLDRRYGIPTFFLKISVANICVAIFNMVGAIISMETGCYPWRSDD